MPKPMDPAKVALIDALNQDLQRKANDLFRYIGESMPYIPRGDEHLVPVFERMIPIDTDNAESLAAAVRMLGGIPSPGCWDLGVADMNYLNVRFVAQQVIGELEKTCGMLEDHFRLAEEYPKVKAILHAVLDDTRFQLEQIREALGRKADEAQEVPA